MIKIRHACKADEVDILSWKNDQLSVESSTSKQIVSKEHHRDWFNMQINTKPCPILLGLIGDKKIGMVRFDRQDNYYDVSINLNPASRGQGLGADMLLKAEMFFFNKNANIRAFVKSDNIASIKLFIKCGYNLDLKSKKSSLNTFTKSISK